ncbi:MAG TPA: hypothetical protein PLD88_14565, partial [Candidatus Berkiella sp.]|nr:hypothetical protein [Candidatus Berkiella sp.]
FKGNSHKTMSKETKSSVQPSTCSSAKRVSESELLDEEETRIINRLLALKDSTNSEIAHEAFRLLKENGIQSYQPVALVETSLSEPSMSTSSSGSTSSPIFSSIPVLDVNASPLIPLSQWRFPSRTIYAQQGESRLSLVAGSSTLRQTVQDDEDKEEDKDKDKKNKKDKKSGRKK